ncbi:MAG: DNA polymerase IV [Phycisphaeraceae bacterium]
MPPDAPRAILHVDMDAFFAAIAQLERAELRGKPVLTGGTGPRSVVSTASYEARIFGCRSAMPMSQARRLCPQAIVVQVERATIRRYSHQLFDLLHEVTPLVEPVSVDEAFLDVTGSDRLHGAPLDIAKRLKQRIHDELKLTASIGVSFNKFLAKLGSDMDKPDGLTVIAPDDVDRVLPPLEIDKLWGVGPRTADRLHRAGLHRVSDVRRYSIEQMRQRFGELGEHLHRLAHGLDDRAVVPDHQAKSIGHEQTFPEDVADRDALRGVLLHQVEQIARRLRRHGLQARGLTLKLRFGEFQTITRSATLERATDVTDELWAAARELFDRWADQGFQPLRLIGAAADRLSGGEAQLALFPDRDQEKRRQLDRTLDRIVDRFGPDVIRRGPAREQGR